LASMEKDLDDREAALVQGTKSLEKARSALEPERRAFEERLSRFDAESRQRQKELDAGAEAVAEDQHKLASEKQSFESFRSERSQWIATKEREIGAREAANPAEE